MMETINPNNSKFTFNQKLTVEHNQEQPVVIVHKVDWNYIKDKLIVNNNWWFLLDKISNIFLGLGFGRLLSYGLNNPYAWLIILASIIGLLVAYIFGNKESKVDSGEILKLMELAEKRQGIGQEDNTTNTNPNTLISNNITENS